jgi:hypothetical protein
MSNANTGGPAFPFEYFDNQLQKIKVVHGMSLRDYFAAKTVHASMTADPANEADADSHARWAYEMADAMLRARAS